MVTTLTNSWSFTKLGVWSITSSLKDGVVVRCLVDQSNEPTAITDTSQSHSASHKKASKVWRQLEDLKTFHDVVSFLRKSGVHLHSFCAVD